MRLTRLFRPTVLATALLFALPASAEEVQITDSARAHFTAGVNYLQDPDGARYEEAYREFKAAYADSPSWKILGNLGLAAMKLERDGEAIEAYEKYLKEGGEQLSEAERAEKKRDLSTLKAGVVYIELEVEPKDANIVDRRVPVRGNAIINRYAATDGKLKIGIRSGHHVITVSAAGFVDQKWEFDASPGSEESKRITLERPKPDEPRPVVVPPGGGDDDDDDRDDGPGPTLTERPVPTAVYVGAAASGVLLVGGGVLGFMAMGKKSDYDDLNDGSNVTEAEAARDSGQQLNLFADVALGLGAIAGGITAVLFFTRPEVPVGGDAGVGVTPAVGPRSAGVSVNGRF